MRPTGSRRSWTSCSRPSATLIGKSPKSWLDEVLAHTVKELSRRGRTQLSAQETDDWCNAVNTVSGATDRIYGLLTKTARCAAG